LGLWIVNVLLARSLPNFAGLSHMATRHSPAYRRAGVSSAQRQASATADDTFDPWTVLEISPGTSEADAKKVYKKMIARYHPDRDPSPEAADKFDKVVRAFAVISGEDKKLDQATLLKNAIENLREDFEFKRKQLEDMKAQMAEAEKELIVMEERMEETETQRSELTKELGALGGAAIGLGVAGPAGALVGGVVGIVFKDRDDVAGQVVRGTGQVVKGLFNAVTSAASSGDDDGSSSKGKK